MKESLKIIIDYRQHIARLDTRFDSIWLSSTNILQSFADIFLYLFDHIAYPDDMFVVPALHINTTTDGCSYMIFHEDDCSLFYPKFESKGKEYEHITYQKWTTLANQFINSMNVQKEYLPYYFDRNTNELEIFMNSLERLINLYKSYEEEVDEEC